MMKNEDILESYLARIFTPHGYFIGSYALMLAIVGMLTAFTGWPLFSVVLLVPFAYAAVVADRRTFDVVPTMFTSDSTVALANAVSIVSAILIGFLALISGLSVGMAIVNFGIIALVKLLTPSVFAILAYEDFKAHIAPIVMKNHGNLEAYELEITTKKVQVAESRRLAAAQKDAVFKARHQVMAFKDEHRAFLDSVMDDAWLYSTVYAEIPDDAPSEKAYAAAASLIERMQKHLVGARTDARSKQQRIADIDAELHKLRADQVHVRNNPVFRDDPVMLEAELAAAEQRINALNEQKRRLEVI